MSTRRLPIFMVACVYVCAQVPSDLEIRKILADRIGDEKAGLAIVVGVVDANGRRVVAYGSLAKGNDRPLSGDTVFEIGSMTKVFTSVVMTDMARRGEVALDDPVGEYLPASVHMPERSGRKITLADLATHSSGLPRMPSNFAPKDPANPYVDYTVEQLYEFLSAYKLDRDIGAEYEYSNLGVGLLGHVLGLRAGMSYEALVRSRICVPLGMADTRMVETPEMKTRLAVGHDSALAAVANWDLPTLGGAGGFRSTANDVLKFLAAMLGFVDSPLKSALADSVSVRRPGENPETLMAYGWEVTTKNGSSIIWKGGATGGYRTYMGFDPEARVGVVVLSNTLRAAMDEIGPHLLNKANPLSSMRMLVHPEIALDATIFDQYVGTYEFDTNERMIVSREGEHFYAQITGQRRGEIFAETEQKFFYKSVDAEIAFSVDAQGSGSQLTLHQSGRDHVGKRLP